MSASAESNLIQCYNPATGEFIGAVPVSTEREIKQARELLRSAFPFWSRKPIKTRLKILQEFSYRLIDSAEIITQVINKESGKSRQDAMVELLMSVNFLARTLREAPSVLQSQKRFSPLFWSKKMEVTHHPYGTVAVIAPWNYPFALAIQPILSALAAGNVVLFKPSEHAPLTGQLIGRLFKQFTPLAPYVQVVQGDEKVGSAVIDSQPDLIQFTGSTATAKKIIRQSAEKLIPTIFELGGKDPMIVLEDADLQAAAWWGVWGSCYHAGQSCVNVERIYVVEEQYHVFVKEAIIAAQTIRVGYSDEVKTPHHYGAISTIKQLEIIEAHLADALAKGAKIVYGGEREGLLMQPTILVNVDHSMRVMREESFGPIIPIMCVKDSAEAIRLANDSDYGLGAVVWTDPARAELILRQLNAGVLVANDTVAHFAIDGIPFGGVKMSGYGRMHGSEELLQFTHTRSYIVGNHPYHRDLVVRLRKPGHYRLAEAVLQLWHGSPRQKLFPLIRLAKSGRLGGFFGRFFA